MANKGSGAESVIVCLRFRPLNENERLHSKDSINVQFCKLPGGNEIESVELTEEALQECKASKKNAKFKFDRIFNWESSQVEVYNKTAAPMVEEVFKGFNCTIFAYGQTGTGKSFTMKGGNSSENAGIIPRIVGEIFDRISSEVNTDEPEYDYEIQVSYVEIYMEKIKDLLNPKNQNGNLKIRESKTKGTFIQSVTEVWVANKSEVYKAMEAGANNRHVASTKMNAESSRSHSVFILKITQINRQTGSKRQSKVFLVDLAGSEKVRKTEAKGKTLDEAKMINKSLSCLGNVIYALTGNKSHVPYRDSKLTRLLSDSLGGNAKTCLIVTCSPSLYNAEETLNSMRFGQRAKLIKNKPKINAERTVEEYKQLLAEAEKQLKQKEILIDALRSGNGVTRLSASQRKLMETSSAGPSLAFKYTKLMEKRNSMQAEIDELKEEVHDLKVELSTAEEEQKKLQDHLKKQMEDLKILQLNSVGFKIILTFLPLESYFL
mmetsp:Transcript_4378/g.6951  ORF Transcript_4378/g.6951 Transcript_4378/m.6951 type:complete len:491 (-) Transcript_4378:2208-3680(-)